MSIMSTKKFVEYVNRGRCAIHEGLFGKKSFKKYFNSNIEEKSENLHTRNNFFINIYDQFSSHLKVM